MSTLTSRTALLNYMATAAIFLAGAIFWQWDLTSDPPMYFSGAGQSLFTDPPQYTFHARNKSLFGVEDPFEYHKFDVFKNSLVSRSAEVWFRITEPSRLEANRVGVILSLLALLFLLGGLAKNYHNWVLPAFALSYLANVTLLTHARLPYLENGLLAIAGAIFFVWSWWGERTAGLIFCGVLGAMAMLMGKLFGLLLLPALGLTVWFSDTPNRIRRITILAASFAVSVVLLAILFYWGNWAAVAGYFGEQTYGLYGFPPGLSTPWGFFGNLVEYGYLNRLYYLSPELCLWLVIVGAIFVRLSTVKGFRFANLPSELRLAIFWLVLAWLAFMPLAYSPIRYALLFIPAMYLFGLTGIEHARRATIAVHGKFHWVEIALLCMLSWVLCYQLLGNTVYWNTSPAPTTLIAWCTLGSGLILGFGLFKWFGRSAALTRPRMATICAAAVVLLGFSNGAYRIVRAHHNEYNRNIEEASRDLKQILSEDAVLSGPYGPTLAQETQLQSFIHHFGVAKIDSSLFDRYPVTHLAVDLSNFETAQNNYPRLLGLQPIATYWICDYQVRIYPVYKVFDNPQAHRYSPSLYERAKEMQARNQLDSARTLMSEHQAEVHRSKAFLTLQAQVLTALKDLDGARAAHASLVEQFPTDFSLALENGFFLQRLSIDRKDPQLFQEAENSYRRVLELNPAKGGYARELFDKTNHSRGRP